MTLGDFVSIAGLAVAVAQLMAALTPGRRPILFTGAAVLALLSVVNLYSSSTYRRQVEAAQEALLLSFKNEPRTYDELRQDLYEIDGQVFDAALNETRRSGSVGLRVLSLKTPTGDIHEVRGYFRIPETASD